MKDLNPQQRMELLLRVVDFGAKQAAASFKRALCAKYGCESCAQIANILAERFATTLAHELGMERIVKLIPLEELQHGPTPHTPPNKGSMN